MNIWISITGMLEVCRRYPRKHRLFEVPRKVSFSEEPPWVWVLLPLLCEHGSGRDLGWAFAIHLILSSRSSDGDKLFRRTENLGCAEIEKNQTDWKWQAWQDEIFMFFFLTKNDFFFSHLQTARFRLRLLPWGGRMCLAWALQLCLALCFLVEHLLPESGTAQIRTQSGSPLVQWR